MFIDTFGKYGLLENTHHAYQMLYDIIKSSILVPFVFDEAIF